MTLEQTERRLRWEKWITGGLWIYLVILSVGLLLLGGKHIDSPRGTWFGILAVLWLLYGGIELLKHFMNRYRVDLLKEIKRVELQVVEMREEMAQRGGSRS